MNLIIVAEFAKLYWYENNIADIKGGNAI